MIYIKGLSNVCIPKSCKITGDKLTLHNLTTKDEYVYDISTDSTGAYYQIQLDESLMVNGQYSYKIESELNGISESGIAQVGNFDNNTTQYQMESTTYKTYNYE